MLQTAYPGKYLSHRGMNLALVCQHNVSKRLKGEYRTVQHPNTILSLHCELFRACTFEMVSDMRRIMSSASLSILFTVSIVTVRTLMIMDVPYFYIKHQPNTLIAWLA